MQISNILLTVLAAGASVVSAQDSTTVLTTSLTKSVTLTKISATPSAAPISSAVSNTTESIATPTPSTFFPLGNSTNSGYASGTGVLHTSTKASATDSTGETSTATGSSAASSSSSAAAPGSQALQGGLLLGAMGAVAMLV